MVAMRTILLLTLSNVFMTIAWYGHLKHRDSPLWIAVLVSWLIALVEYCFQVPANRYGAERFSPIQLKVMQEIITLVVFAGFAMLYLGQRFAWNHLAAFALIVAAVMLVRRDDGNLLRDGEASSTMEQTSSLN
jgi:uncharacterized protein (DUF486 family)